MNLCVDDRPLPVSYFMREPQEPQDYWTTEEIDEEWEEYGSRVRFFMLLLARTHDSTGNPRFVLRKEDYVI